MSKIFRIKIKKSDWRAFFQFLDRFQKARFIQIQQLNIAKSINNVILEKHIYNHKIFSVTIRMLKV